jgi:hypothetical protein
MSSFDDRVLVNPFGAECDLAPHGTRKVPPSTSSPPAAIGPGQARYDNGRGDWQHA